MFLTVLIPAYNAARHLTAAVDSVLAQTHRDFELLVIDDGSTDETPAILGRYAQRDGRVRVVSQANAGMGRSLNRGLGLARGEWVARLDADDEMLPDRLERQVAFVNEHPGLDLTATLVNYVDGGGRVIGRSRSELTTPQAVEAAVARNELIHVHHPAVMARRSALLAAGGFRPEFWPADDVDLWNRLVERGCRLLVQPEHLTNYRIHGWSACVASSRRATRKLEWVEACMKARRSGAAEPTWEEFEAALNRRPLPARMNQARKDVARAWYKAATLHFSQRNYHRFVPALAGAAILEPEYVWEKLSPRLAARSPLSAVPRGEG